MDKEKGYTPDQIRDAEKLCQLMQKVPDARRQMFSVSVLAYMNGFEAGIAMGQDTKSAVMGQNVIEKQHPSPPSDSAKQAYAKPQPAVCYAGADGIGV